MGDTTDLDNLLVVTLEVEMLDDGEYRQFTQLGSAITDPGKMQVSFFRSILPQFMEDYNKNLILKHQNNLLSSLGLKYDEQLKKYLFEHKKKNENVQPFSEERALIELLSFIKSYCKDKKSIIFMHSKETYLPLLAHKLQYYKMLDDFAEQTVGFCDYSSLMSK